MTTSAQAVQGAAHPGADADFEADFYAFAKVKPPEDDGGIVAAEGDDDDPSASASDVIDDDTQAAAAAAPAPAPAEAPTPAPAPVVAAPAPAAAAAPAPVVTAPAPAASALTDDELLALLPADKAEAARALLASGNDAKHRLASEIGRQAALQRLLAEQRDRSEALEAKLAAASTPTDAAAAQAAVDAAQAAEKKTEDALSKEFPELSGPITMRIEQVVKGMLPPRTEEPAAKPAPSPAPAASQAEEVDPDIRYADEYTELFKVHPTWQADVQSANYDTWIKRQPAGVRAMGDSENVEDALWLLNQFKRSEAEAKANVRGDDPGKREELRGHVEPRRSAGPKVEGAATGGDTFENHFEGFAATRKRGA